MHSLPLRTQLILSLPGRVLMVMLDAVCVTAGATLGALEAARDDWFHEWRQAALPRSAPINHDAVPVEDLIRERSSA